jgi:hypothetical protein
MRAIGFLLVLLGIAVLWIWFLLIRQSPDSKTSAWIMHKAKMDMLDACNRALTIEGRLDRFSIEDVRIAKLNQSNIEAGVITLVSVLEASHGNLHCRWSGENTAQISVD